MCFLANFHYFFKIQLILMIFLNNKDLENCVHEYKLNKQGGLS